MRSFAPSRLPRVGRRAVAEEMTTRHEQAWPTREERLVDENARVAYRAQQRERAGRVNGTTPPPAHPLVWAAWCQNCSEGTSNWCDRCELNHETFVTLQGQTFVGRPMCGECTEDPLVACRTCGHVTNELHLAAPPGGAQMAVYAQPE